MKSVKMHSFYLVPLLVLAVVACAKRDSEFSKKGTNNRTDVQKVTDQSRQNLPKETAYVGDLDNTFKEVCMNMISMDADSEKGEEEIVLSDIITKEKESYILQSTELFAERTDKESKVAQQVTFAGSAFELPNDFKTRTQGQKTVVTCHNLKLDEAAKQELSADLIMPYDISTESGEIKILRQDKVELRSAKKATVSTLYAQSMNLKDVITKDLENKKILILKHKDSSDITIKIQNTTTDKKTGTVLKKTISGTYALKKY